LKLKEGIKVGRKPQRTNCVSDNIYIYQEWIPCSFISVRNIL
jgi:hypothetical protein